MQLNSAYPVSGHYIAADGSTITTAPIPFAVGLSSVGLSTFTGAAAQVPLTVNANASQTANLFVINDYDGSIGLKVRPQFSNTRPLQLVVGPLAAGGVAGDSANSAIIGRRAASFTTGSNVVTGVEGQSIFTGTGSSSSKHYGLSAFAATDEGSTGNLTSTIGGLIGVQIDVQHWGTGTVTKAVGAKVVLTTSSLGTPGPIGTIVGYEVLPNLTGALGITEANWILLRSANIDPSVLPLWYGIKIGEITGPTTRYAIALGGGGVGMGVFFNTPNRAGLEYIRSTNTGYLNLGAGTGIQLDPLTSNGFVKTNSGNGTLSVGTTADLLAAIGNADDDAVTKGVSTYVDNDFNATAGVVSINQAGNFSWTGNHDFITDTDFSAHISLGQNAYTITPNMGLAFGGMTNSMATGIIGHPTQSDETIWGINTSQLGDTFADLGYAVDGGVQGIHWRFNATNGECLGGLVFQDNQSILGGGQFSLITISDQGRLGLGLGVILETNAFTEEVFIQGYADCPFGIQQDASGAQDLQRWRNRSGDINAYIDKDFNFVTIGSITAGTTLTGTTGITGAFLALTNDTNQIYFDSDSANATILQDSATALRTVTLPDSTTTLAGLSTTQTFSGVNTFSSASGIILSSASPLITFTDTTIGEDDYTISVNSSIFKVRNTTDGQDDFSIDGSGNMTLTRGNVTITIPDKVNISVGTGSGTSFGALTTQKIGFYGSTTTQPAGSTDVLASLVTLGLRAASSNPPLNLGSGAITSGAVTASGDITITKAIPKLIYTDSGGDDYEASVGTVASEYRIRNTTDARNDLTIDGSGAWNTGGSLTTAGNITISKATPLFQFTDSGGDDYSIDVGAAAASRFRIRNSTTGTNVLDADTAGNVAVSLSYAPQSDKKFYVQDRATSASAATKAAFGATMEVVTSGAWAGGNMRGFLGGVTYIADQNFNNGSSMIGLEGGVTVISASNTQNGLVGLFGTISASGGSTITAASGVGTFVSIGTNTVVTTLKHITTGATQVSGGAAITNLYGFYSDAMTAGGSNYEGWMNTDAGWFFREAGNQLNSRAAGEFDLDATTKWNARIGGTVEIVLTATQLDLMSATTDRVNFIAGAGGAAPGTNVGAAIVNYYGAAATNFLGDPTGWLDVKINGVARKIPYY